MGAKLQRPSFALLGPGRMGTGLTLALNQAGWKVAKVWGRSARGKARARRLLGTGTTSKLQSALADVSLVILGISDDGLADFAHQLAPWAEGKTWLHLSGSQGRDVLSPLADAGGRTIALHPIQTIADPRIAPEWLRGTVFSLVALDADYPLAKRIVEAVGGIAVRMRGADRPLYHAAAVVACNELTALLGIAERLFRQATAGQLGLQDLLPLVKGTIAGVLEKGPEKALTGPVARGDIEVIKRHLAAIRKQAPWAMDVYRCLGLATVDLARGRDNSENNLDQIRDLLE